MPEEVLYKLIDYARGIGQREERINSFKEPQFISQNKAHKKYGKGDVSKWVKAGLVKRYKDADGKLHSRVRYDILELESAAFKCNGKSSVSCPLKPSDSTPLKHSTMPP